METSKYSLGFTTGAAMIRESKLVAGLYVELQNWSNLRSQVLTDNSFQSRTESTLKTIYGAVSNRLKHLTDDQLRLLSMGTDSQAKALVWLAICRHYKFIYDFTTDVVIPHYEMARYVLTYEDYNEFFNTKAEWHGNLDATSNKTKAKARQVLFRILKECGIVGMSNEVQHQQLDEQLVQIIKASSLDDLRLYPGMASQL